MKQFATYVSKKLKRFEFSFYRDAVDCILELRIEFDIYVMIIEVELLHDEYMNINLWGESALGVAMGAADAMEIYYAGDARNDYRDNLKKTDVYVGAEAPIGFSVTKQDLEMFGTMFNTFKK